MAHTSSKLNEHLTNTLLKLMIENPIDAYNNFELISSFVKSNQPNNANKPELNSQQLERRNQTTSKVFASVNKALPESEYTLDVLCPQLINEFNLLEWANVTLDKSSIYQLNYSIQKLAETLSPDAKRLRFFGIIYTLSLPYYVVESISPADIDDVDDYIREGTNGVNKYTYYVSQAVHVVPTEWIVLPPVTMDQITSTRKIKRFLSGNINAKVPSYPPFPGYERNYLRALIAEIVGSTSISPVGLYEIDEESDVPAVKPADPVGHEFRTVTDLQQPEFWKHHEFKPNSIGRITALLPKLNDDENESSAEIQSPAPLEDINPADWTFRIFQGDNLVVARNTAWPGAITVATRNTVLNTYFGYGVRHNTKRFEPVQPPNIEIEYELSQDTSSLLIHEDILIDPNPVELESDFAQENDDDDQDEVNGEE